jgi:2,5-furandicarboxylate decarboxylase 1
MSIAPDLRSFLAERGETHPHDFLHIEQPISLKHELTELQYKLWQAGKHPVILAHQPIRTDGTISPFRLITNMGASRDVCAAALRISNGRRAAIEYSKLAASPIAPVTVPKNAATVKEVIKSGAEVNILDFPIVWQHQRDAGPYLTAAHVTTYDPDSGIDNTAIQRAWVKAGNRTGLFPYPGSHNHRNIEKFWKKGKPAPVAMWIGHHPAIVLASQAKLGYPQSHWDSVGGFLGQPVRLVATETFGEQLLVPADAEIVIEGYVVQQLEDEGPFGEFTGWTGGIRPAPVFEVTCISHRKDAIYHDYASGLPDMLVADNMALEAKIFDIVKTVVPTVQNVHVPISGRRFHAYIQLGAHKPSEARDALTAALSFRRVKHAIVVDSDIDIFDETQVWWAVATRSQWNKDLILLEGLSGSSLDPSLPDDGGGVSAKAGIDATLKPGQSTGSTPSIIPTDIKQKVKLEDYVSVEALSKFPGTF